MQYIESRIGHSQKPLCNATKTNAIFYSSFYDGIEDDDMELPYGDELIDVKVEEIFDTYLDTLDDYIGAGILIPGRYSLTVLGKSQET